MRMMGLYGRDWRNYAVLIPLNCLESPYEICTFDVSSTNAWTFHGNSLSHSSILIIFCCTLLDRFLPLGFEVVPQSWYKRKIRWIDGQGPCIKGIGKEQCIEMVVSA